MSYLGHTDYNLATVLSLSVRQTIPIVSDITKSLEHLFCLWGRHVVGALPTALAPGAEPVERWDSASPRWATPRDDRVHKRYIPNIELFRRSEQTSHCFLALLLLKPTAIDDKHVGQLPVDCLWSPSFPATHSTRNVSHCFRFSCIDPFIFVTYHSICQQNQFQCTPAHPNNFCIHNARRQQEEEFLHETAQIRRKRKWVKRFPFVTLIQKRPKNALHLVCICPFFFSRQHFHPTKIWCVYPCFLSFRLDLTCRSPRFWPLLLAHWSESEGGKEAEWRITEVKQFCKCIVVLRSSLPEA